MRTKFLRAGIPLMALLCVWQVGQAAPGETESLETPSPATPAMQTALAQSSAQHSDGPLLALLAAVPKREQATLALNLFLNINDDVEARRRVGTLILLAPSSIGEIQRRHLLLLTQAYLQTIEHPLKWPEQNLDSGRNYDDSLFQRKTRLLIAAYFGVRASPRDWSRETTPLDKLKLVFAEAENSHLNPTVSGKIQACKSLLPP